MEFIKKAQSMHILYYLFQVYKKAEFQRARRCISNLSIFVFPNWMAFKIVERFTFHTYIYFFSRSLSSEQVPIIIPYVVLIISIYLVIGPIIDNPQIEYLYALGFIFAGLIFYVPFVKFGMTPRFMSKYPGTDDTCALNSVFKYFSRNS